MILSYQIRLKSKQSVTENRFSRQLKRALFLLIFLIAITANQLIAQDSLISFSKSTNSFPISILGKTNSLYISRVDHQGAIRAMTDLQKDLESVTQSKPSLLLNNVPSEENIIIAGTIGVSPAIDQLIKEKKIDVSKVQGQWEAFQIQIVFDPFPNVKKALVITGSDKRGTIFGIYEISRQIGVSPWYWWADVPLKKHKNIYVNPIIYTSKPAIKYRGIFLNDEEPALGRWAVEKYGGFNHQFYEKLFELMLRMKANYLWPAMWWASFNSNDTLNPKLANEYGIVMGTTHHEPMMRAHSEWKAENGGEWNYETNEKKLKEFWTVGIKRMKDYESIVTLAMRGDGDKAMTAETNVALLEKIVKDQREIIHEVTGKSPTEVPQLWALYKEVQDYYDNGMRVPDDVMLLLCDDNWGNIRKLPKTTDAPRKGGYGIYYHFDYVGGPRNYKWLNTNPLPRIWEQMNLAYRYGATDMWLVNVGDLKPIEFPTEFFLDFAWNPEKWKSDNLEDYTYQWVVNQFGKTRAKEITEVLSKYAKYNARRKPELLNIPTYSLTNYNEFESIVSDYIKIEKEAHEIYKTISPELKDAYYQLILYPVKTCANLNRMYLALAKNKFYAEQKRAFTNTYADSVSYFFKQDSLYSNYYNNTLANGKWHHMMDQTHISYTYWQQPEKDVLPKTEHLTPLDHAEMGVSIEGSSKWWPQEKTEAVLPEFDANNKQKYFIEIFNSGSKSFDFTVQPSVKWLTTSSSKGTIDKEIRLIVSVDWTKAPQGKSNASIVIKAKDGNSVTIKTIVNNSALMIQGFAESNGCISMEAVHYSKANNSNEVTWKILPDHGRTLSAVTTFPVTAESKTPEKSSPSLEYDIQTTSQGEVKVNAYFSPSIDFHNGGGLKYAVSIDDETPQIINIHSVNSMKAWEKSVSENIIISSSTHTISKPGKHVVKYWMVDSAVVLQKLVLDFGGVKESYLGPSESYYSKPN